MKNLLFCLTCCLLFFFCFGQKVKEVIDAEKKFAAHALQHSTREAFLQFLDSNAVMFDNGQIVDAKKLWLDIPGSTVKLLWKPAFAGIAASGDLAFTTGPWEIRSTLNDTSISSGQFATIWVKAAAGEWKFLVDLGITAGQKMDEYKEVDVAAAGKVSLADTATVARLEREINRHYDKDGAGALINSAAEDCRYIIENHRPLQNISEIRSRAKKITPAGIRFTPVTVAAASSGDLAYAYGYVHQNDKQGNYLRIWQNTNNGWKIILILIK